MELLSSEELNQTYHKNNATLEEWEIITNYLTTGKVSSKYEAQICYENFQKNSKWFQEICSMIMEKNYFIAGNFYFFGIFPTVASFPILAYIDGIFTPFLRDAIWIISAITLNILAGIIYFKLYENKRRANVTKFILEPISSAEVLEHSQNKANEKSQSNNQELQAVKKYDLFLKEISDALDKILMYKYPGFSQDVYDLKQLSEHYKNNGKTWEDLDLQTKQVLIRQLANIEGKINQKIEALQKAEEINNQFQDLVIDKIAKEFGSDYEAILQETHNTEDEEVNKNADKITNPDFSGPKLVLDVSKRKNIEIKK